MGPTPAMLVWSQDGSQIYVACSGVASSAGMLGADPTLGANPQGEVEGVV